MLVGLRADTSPTPMSSARITIMFGGGEAAACTQAGARINMKKKIRVEGMLKRIYGSGGFQPPDSFLLRHWKPPLHRKIYIVCNLHAMRSTIRNGVKPV